MLRTSFTGGLDQLWENDFTVSLSTVSFFFQVLFSFLFFGCPFLPKTDCRALCFFEFLMKRENGFQKKNLSSFNLCLIWFEHRGTFSCGLLMIPSNRLKETLQRVKAS